MNEAEKYIIEKMILKVVDECKEPLDVSNISVKVNGADSAFYYTPDIINILLDLVYKGTLYFNLNNNIIKR